VIRLGDTVNRGEILRTAVAEAKETGRAGARYLSTQWHSSIKINDAAQKMDVSVQQQYGIMFANRMPTGIKNTNATAWQNARRISLECDPEHRVGDER
jgi:hypothetical protein